MTAGDVVSGISNVASILDFQPAAGVECMITVLLEDGSAGGCAVHLYDGANSSRMNLYDTAPGAGATYPAVKWFIRNGLYLRFNAIGGGRSGYSGIQTK